MRPCSDLSAVYTLLFHIFFTMLPYSLSPMGKEYKELWVQRGWGPGAVEMEPSSSRPLSTFLIYFASHLSQCVDCIITAVTESHASIINDSAGPKPEPHRLALLLRSPACQQESYRASSFFLTALRQMSYSSVPCWTESLSFQGLLLNTNN